MSYQDQSSSLQDNILNNLNEDSNNNTSSFECSNQHLNFGNNTKNNINTSNQELHTQKEENENKLIEPMTHVKNKGCLEKLGCCCCRINYDLNKREINQFNSFKRQCNIPFDINDNEHILLLKNLYYLLRDEELEDIETENWMQYGFQSKNANTDFRGGGIIALKNLIMFTNNNLELVMDMALEQNKFFFACSSINITHFLKKFLHLSSNLDIKNKDQFCDRKSLKNFCVLMVEDEEIFYNFHQILLKDLFESCWLGLIEQKNIKGKQISYMDFGIALNAVKDKFKKTLKFQMYNNFEEFKHIFQIQPTKLDESKKYHDTL